MKRASVLIFMICLFGCRHKENFDIQDATKYQKFNIVSRLENPSGVTLTVRGNINGVAKIYISAWNPIELSGQFEKEIYQDWFESTCEVTYDPTSVRWGYVEIECIIR